MFVIIYPQFSIFCIFKTHECTKLTVHLVCSQNHIKIIKCFNDIPPRYMVMNFDQSSHLLPYEIFMYLVLNHTKYFFRFYGLFLGVIQKRRGQNFFVYLPNSMWTFFSCNVDKNKHFLTFPAEF